MIPTVDKLRDRVRYRATLLYIMILLLNVTAMHRCHGAIPKVAQEFIASAISACEEQQGMYVRIAT